MQKKVSIGAMKNIFDFSFKDKVEHTVDYVFQVLTFKTSMNMQKGFFVSSVTLSDITYKKSGFLFFHLEEHVDIAPYDLVRINKLTPTLLTKNDVDNYFFVVKSFELECKCEQLFGSPEEFKMTENAKGSSTNLNSKSSSSVQSQFTSSTSNINTGYHRTSQLSSTINPSGGFNDVPKGMPLSALSSFSKDFTIIVKITSKNALKQYTNNKGDGCLFGFTIMDNEGTEMDCTAFNVAAKKVFGLIQKDKVYSIKGCYMKINDKKYATVKNDYKMILEDNVEIKEIHNDQSFDQSNFKFNFVKISEIENLLANEAVEVIGKVIEVGESREVSTKNGQINLKKIKIVDISETSIEISLWRQHADQDFTKGEIVIFKNIKISSYNNSKILNTIESTSVIKDLNIPERTELELFFSNKTDVNFKSLGGKQTGGEGRLGDISFLQDVNNAVDASMNQDKAPLFKVKATISSFMNSEKNYYLGCSECNKKILDDGLSNKLQCQSCNKIQDKHNYIYTLSLRIKDSTSEEYIDIYGALAEKLTKMKCEDYRDLVESHDETKLRQLKNEIEYKQYYFLVKPKMHVFNNNARKKIATIKIERVDSSTESNRLNGVINQFLNNFSI